jgi:hypothetical protein
MDIVGLISIITIVYLYRSSPSPIFNIHRHHHHPSLTSTAIVSIIIAIIFSAIIFSAPSASTNS